MYPAFFITLNNNVFLTLQIEGLILLGISSVKIVIHSEDSGATIEKNS